MKGRHTLQFYCKLFYYIKTKNVRDTIIIRFGIEHEGFLMSNLNFNIFILVSFQSKSLLLIKRLKTQRKADG